MWIILGVFLSISAWALEPFERISNIKILRVLPNNVVMINRGLEDGILRNDHAKFNNDVAGYSARAICLRVTGDVSYWRLYRIPNTEAFSMDYTYNLIGMADREIPFPEAQIRDARQVIAGLEEKKTEDAGPNPFAIKRDLPERLTERDLLKASGPEQRKLFVEQTLNKDLLERDLRDYQVSVYASPFTRQSINSAESLVYGFRGGNIGSRYKLLMQFEQQQTKLKDPQTRESVSTRSTTGNAQFVVNRLSNSISSLSLINYNSQRFSSLGTPKSDWHFGPLGFTWHIYESDNWQYLDLSYVPLYTLRTVEIADASDKKIEGIRHGFRLAFRTKINERVAIENLLWVRPFQNMGSGLIESDNLNLQNDLKMVFSLTEKLFFDYNLIYQKDKLWKTLSNLPDTNTINSLNLRYDFNL